MATRRLTAGDVVVAIYDNDFGISDGDSSRQEDGEDIYAYMGDAAKERRRLREESRRLTSSVENNTNSSDVADAPDSKDDSEVAADLPASHIDNCSSHNSVSLDSLSISDSVASSGEDSTDTGKCSMYTSS